MDGVIEKTIVKRFLQNRRPTGARLDRSLRSGSNASRIIFCASRAIYPRTEGLDGGIRQVHQQSNQKDAGRNTRIVAGDDPSKVAVC
ncbi:hypothetical protein [Sphingomonas sp. SAFR-052]|uniref:hypothetical protein n=1 Tax=Sphingomonas sp. SAFR-052 TaxID=3436867 RepID=UPI003F7E352D